MLSPLPRRSGWADRFARQPSRVSLPRKGHRVGLRIVLFEACSAFTRITACTLALSPIRDTHSEGFSYHLHSCSGCFRLERSPGGTCTHWKAPPYHGAHPERTFVASLRDLQNCAAQADLVADFRLLRATLSEGRLAGANRLRRDLARNIAAYPAFLPILLSLQEG